MTDFSSNFAGGDTETASAQRGGAPTAREKKMVYIVNRILADDTQHFVHLTNLLRELSGLGWSVLLLSERGGQGHSKVLGHEVRYLSRSSGTRRVFALVRELVAARRRGYRLVFVRISKLSAILSGFLGWFLGMKTLYWQSGTNRDLDEQQPIIARLVEKVRMRALIMVVSRFVTGPERMLGYYEREYRVPKRKLLLLYNDIDIGRFSRRDPRVERDGALRVLFVHSFSPSKRASFYLPKIIESLSEIVRSGRKIVLDLVGSGPEQPLIEEIASRSVDGLEINLLGAVPNIELPELYASADIFIMPSYREGMPRALMEAMASGLPAVSTDAGGVRDLVGAAQAQFVVSRDDPQAFADKLAMLVLDENLRAKLGQENAASIMRFTTPEVARMYDEKLGNLL